MMTSDLFKFTIENIQDLILWINPQGRIQNANQGACTALNISKKELLNSSIFDIRTDIASDQWSDYWAKAKKNGAIGGVGVFLSKDTQPTSYRLNANYLLLPSGEECLCLVGRTSSIRSNRLNTGNNIQEFYETILNYLGDYVFVKDREHRYLFNNDAGCKAIGETLENLIGKLDYDYFPKEQADVFWEKDEKVFATGKDDINEEGFTNKKGELQTILTHKKLYVSPTGEKFIVGVSKDISQLKKVEKKLKRTNDILEQKVLERTLELKESNDGLEIKVEQLNYLNKKSQYFSQLIKRDDVLSAIFKTFVERAPAGQIVLCEFKENMVIPIHQTSILSQKTPSQLSLDLIEISRTSMCQEISYREYWLSAPEISNALSSELDQLPHCLFVPLCINQSLIGCLQIFNTLEKGTELVKEESMLNTLASQMAVALDNANHYLDLEIKVRIESELEVARKLQQKYTPEAPSIPEIAIKGICMPANEVGGDYLDYFQNEQGDWVIAIADVCGKGVPAALVMTSLRSAIRAEGRRISSSKKLLHAVNLLLGPDLEREHSFITCMVIVIHKDSHSMNFCRAGHPLLLSFNLSPQVPIPIPSEGLAIGLLPGKSFESVLEEVEVPLKSGDRFLAYTDGLDEAMNSQKETYGIKRLIASLNKTKDSHPDQLIDNVLKDVNKFVDGQRQFDDLTVLAFEKK